MDHRFEELKRYNISEIFDPTPKEAVKEGKAEVAAEVETQAEAVPTVNETAATEEVGDKAVEGDSGVSVANDDATSRDKDSVSVVKDELQADVPESSAGAPQ